MSALTGWIWAIGRLLGLSTAAGVRMWLTTFVMALLSREGLGFSLPDAFTWLENPVVLGLLLVLTIVEIAADKVPSVDRMTDRLFAPLRLVVGAVIGACALGHGVVGLVIGLPVGALLTWIGLSTRRRWRPRVSPGSTILPLTSLAEDLGAGFAAALSAVLPPAGYAVFGWTAWYDRSLRRRRMNKYRRIRDGGPDLRAAASPDGVAAPPPIDTSDADAGGAR